MMADKSLFPPSSVRTIEDIAREQAARLTTADALAKLAQRISDNAFTDEDGSEFVICPEDKVELDDALCEYWKVSDA